MKKTTKNKQTKKKKKTESNVDPHLTSCDFLTSIVKQTNCHPPLTDTIAYQAADKTTKK